MCYRHPHDERTRLTASKIIIGILISNQPNDGNLINLIQVLDNMNDTKDANFELNTLAVKDLNLKQLQSLQVS